MIKKLLNSKFKKDLIFSYATQAISISFGFLQLFLINRYFGVNIYGQLAIIMSTAGIFSSLLTARSSEAVTRFFKREELNKNYENAKFVLFIGFVIDFITAMILVLLIYISAEFISTTFLKNESLQQEIVLYSIVIFFGFLRGSFIGFLQSQELFKEINTIAIVESVLKVTFLLISIFVLHRYGLNSVIYVLILASLFSFLYTLYLFFKYYKDKYIRIRFVFNTLILKEYWNFNIKTFISSSLKVGASNIDNLILGYYTNTMTVGIYQTIRKILLPLSLLISPFSTLTLPKFIFYFEQKQFMQLNELIKKITIKLFLLSIVLLVILFLLLQPYLSYQNIQYSNTILISFFILAIHYILQLFMWWGRNFIILYNPILPIYSNLLLSINSIWIPIMLFQINYFDELITICLGILLAYIPSWLFAPIIYLKFMKKEKVIP